MTLTHFNGDPVRLLVVPGLHDSGPTHWQSWLEGQYRKRAHRVRQDDWDSPDVLRWAARVRETIERFPQSRWIAVAHSFGCLALLRYLQECQSERHEATARSGRGVLGALLVAPADPDKFGVASQLPHARLAVPSIVLASETDPWLRFELACAWARVWGSQLISLGDVGHINVEAGFGPLPRAKALVETMIQRLERARRLDHAHPLERSFAI
jgi:predicted alpha/beta hydrolase family esterase